jgi:hypothetical protein
MTDINIPQPKTHKNLIPILAMGLALIAFAGMLVFALTVKW